MKKIILPIIIVAAVIIGLVVMFVLPSDDENTNVNSSIVTNEIVNEDVNTDEILIKDNNDTNSAVNENINNNGETNINAVINTNTTIVVNENTNVAEISTSTTPGQYVNYSPTILSENVNQKRVLFFHAGWCPTCRIANTDFIDNESEIPNGVVVIKTDYDSEDELKDKYGVTYQHVFIQIDANGNEIKKWNGGGLDNLISKVR